MGEIIFLDECGSTNDYIREHLSELSDCSAVTAKLQTAGRGRRGHTWLADGGMIPLSILFKNPVERDTLTARVGLAVCESIENLCDISKLGIKWPNDVIIENKKICGILCECSLYHNDACVICGIGVNLSQDKRFFDECNLPNAASIKMFTDNIPNREALVEEIVKNAVKRVQMPFSECLDEFKARMINLGKTVKLISTENERIAKAVDIAPNGFLICEDENGRFEVGSGEVSVRGESGYI